MANSTILTTFLANLVLDIAPKSWEMNCIEILNTSGYSWSTGLVDQYGLPVSALTNATWGIDLATCSAYCNASAIPYALDFNFQTFSGALTNYFLPWLALTAQLTFETGDAWSNIMSFCLAVGSPAMVTYSLSITILNRYWIRKAFHSLRSDSGADSVKKRWGELGERIDSAQFLLQEAQQVPLRASQARGWFSSLLVIPENAMFWEHVRERLEDTRRGITASLVAQMLFAAIAYLFTVITSFNADLGDPATALQIASGSLWIWLIPVIFGWITVGTQSSHGTVERALKQQAHRALEPHVTQAGWNLTEEDQQAGLIVGVGFTPQPRVLNHQSSVGGFETPPQQLCHPQSWFGADVRGDERQKGPIYNYARLFTWYQLANTLMSGLEQIVDNVNKGRTPGSLQAGTTGTHAIPQGPNLVPPPNAVRWDPNRDAAENMEGDSLDVARYCGLVRVNNTERHPIMAYPHWGRDDNRPERSFVSAAVYQRIFAASLAAIFVSWGTTGASVIIAYLTPTVGLGCRSGGYVLYAGLGTVVWLLLLTSMLLSHQIMLEHQEIHIQNPSTDFRVPELSGFRHGLLCGAAVITRIFGKFLAIVNTLWLILSSLFEFIGAYDNCWCKANSLSLGSKGWVVLFKDATDLALTADLSWSGGLAMTLIVCITSYTFFALGSRNTGDR